jgi:hypothetical protein
MAGLVPAIHVFLAWIPPRRGCPAPAYAKASTGFRCQAAVALAKAARPGDELYWNTPFHRLHLSQTLRSAKIGA